MRGSREEEEKACVAGIADAVRLLESFSCQSSLLQPGGIEIAFALPRAKDTSAVASVVLALGAGRIIPPERISFGAGGEAARCALTVIRFDPQIRAAGVIRYSPEATGICEDLLFQTCSYDQSREPPGIQSMHWGVAQCCREGVPDVVYDTGGHGTDGLIRLFAENPVRIARTIQTIGSRMRH